MCSTEVLDFGEHLKKTGNLAVSWEAGTGSAGSKGGRVELLVGAGAFPASQVQVTGRDVPGRSY